MTTDMSDERIEYDIERAIKARGLRESMAQWDQEMTKQTIRPLWVRVSRPLGYSVAAAAMLAGILFTPIQTHTVVEYQNLARTTGAEIHDLYLTAGAGSADLVYQATDKMNAGDFRAAHKLLCNAEIALDEEFTDHSDIQYTETLEDIRQLKALCDLSRGQLFYTIRGKLNLR